MTYRGTGIDVAWIQDKTFLIMRRENFSFIDFESQLLCTSIDINIPVHGAWNRKGQIDLIFGISYWIILFDLVNSRSTTFFIQFSSVQSLSHVPLCNPMNCSTPGLCVHHKLLEFTQTHVHRVGDAIQQSHPLSSPSPTAPNPSQHQGFSNELPLCMKWPKYWNFSFSVIPSNEHPGLISLGGLVGSPCSTRDSQESSPIPQFKSINSLVLRFLQSPTLTSIHDQWKNHSLD